mmetsp:Transcript_17719/g.45594  ORF Transcript_17719/g.45594 Transcript_17719/m.45594 type:complete len:218 (-) Transcript_17719:178-831(-)
MQRDVAVQILVIHIGTAFQENRHGPCRADLDQHVQGGITCFSDVDTVHVCSMLQEQSHDVHSGGVAGRVKQPAARHEPPTQPSQSDLQNRGLQSCAKSIDVAAILAQHPDSRDIAPGHRLKNGVRRPARVVLPGHGHCQSIAIILRDGLGYLRLHRPHLVLPGWSSWRGHHYRLHGGEDRGRRGSPCAVGRRRWQWRSDFGDPRRRSPDWRYHALCR